MISVQSNLGNVITSIIGNINSIDIDAMTREQASTLMAVVRERVHEKGLASDNSQIGTYSNGYLKLRSGKLCVSSYKNAGKFSKGKNAGKNKNSGVYTKGSNRGQARPNYNRGSNPKVILSLTRQMENSMVIIPVDGGCAIGYNNSLDYQKSQWAEKTYRKSIWNLTENELKTAKEIAERYAKNALE